MYCVSGFLRFFRSLHSEQIAQLHPGFMQLGLAVAYRTAHDSRDLIMFVTFDVVKHKDRTIAGREVVHCPLQLLAVNRPSQRQVFRPEVLLRGIFLTHLRRFFQ
jgi:hypothetical protein